MSWRRAKGLNKVGKKGNMIYPGKSKSMIVVVAGAAGREGIIIIIMATDMMGNLISISSHLISYKKELDHSLSLSQLACREYGIRSKQVKSLQ